MKRHLSLVLLLTFAGGLTLEGKTSLPEAQQQARLLRFKPEAPRPLDMKQSDRELLARIAKDTWVYFRDLVDRENGLVIDNVLLAGPQSRVGSFTSTTNVGIYMMCVVGAAELGYLTPLEAQGRLKKLFATLNKLEHWEGQLFNYYETVTLEPSRRFVSSVDNGWLAAGMIVARQAFPALAADIDPMLNAMDFARLYDPEVGQLYGGIEVDKGQPTSHHYGLLCTEPRVASYIGIAKGDLPRRHWYRLFRTLPLEWEWQSQRPRGTVRTREDVEVFYGHYEHGGARYVPSWGGSLFEFLMPTLVLDEQRLSPQGFGANNKAIVEAQIHYALKEKGYPVWGMSPCATPDRPDGYKEFGVPFLGTKGYADEGVITPHASFLALTVNPEAAIANIRRMADIPGLYGPYGFYDAVSVKTDKIANRYLALDQGMTFVALVNFLKEGVIQKRFLSYPPMQDELDLLRTEDFGLGK